MTFPTIGSSAVQSQQQFQRHQPPPLTNTAQLLGMTPDDLRKAQQSGTTLASLATGKGISKDDLVKSIASDLKAAEPQGATGPSDAQLTQMATNIADGKRPGHPGGHHHHHGSGSGGSDGGGSTSSASGTVPGVGSDPDGDGDQHGAGAAASPATSSGTSALAQLASALGIDPANLLTRITTQEGLGSLLSFAPPGSYNSSGAPGSAVAATAASGGLVLDTHA